MRVTAFLITTGEPSTSECRRRLEAQTHLVRVVEIANVAPMDAAFQRMLDLCETPLYVQVDADMLLEPWAVERLVATIDAAPPEVALVVAWLWGDAEERPIQGVKVYRHKITRRFPYAAALSCEMPQIATLRQAGYGVLSLPEPSGYDGCFGVHFSLQTPEMAFARQQRLAHKYRARDYMAWWREYPRRYLERWRTNPSPINEAAMLGALAGLVGPLPPETEMDATRVNLDRRRLLATFGDWSKGPVGLNLYVTDRCNAKCPMCWRTLSQTKAAAEIDPALMPAILSTFPTVQAVCLAGFGEPLLHRGLGAIVAACKQRGLYVSLITNGLLLMQRLGELVSWGLDHVVVSLNATSAEEHAAAQGGTNAWGTVLEGIRQARYRGVPVGIGYIATRKSVQSLPALLAIAETVGAGFVEIPNLLPHDGISARFLNDVLTTTSPEIVLVEQAKKLPGARLVRHWPTPIAPGTTPPLRCESPFRSIGVGADGMVTPCRRIVPPSARFGYYSRFNVWNDLGFANLRAALLGDRPLPQECAHCFGCWSG